jgi:uncharacterized membrane protein YbhN (UPF0104 family)
VSRQAVKTLLLYLLALTLLAWVIKSNWGTPGSNGLGDVWQKHVVEGAPVHVGFFAAAFVIYVAAVMLTLVRWYLLVRAQDLPLTPANGMRLGFVGLFFNAFLPGSVGGDIVKAAALARGQSRRTVAVATVVMDRVIALCGLVWFVALLGSAFWLAGQLEDEAGARCKVIVAIAGGVVAASLAGWALLGLLPQRRADRFAGRLGRLPKVGGAAAEMWRAVWLYRCRPKVVYLVMVLSWVGHVGFCVAFYCAARTLSSDGMPTLTQHFLIVPIGLVVQAVIPFPGGMGVGEWGFGALYELLGARRAVGVLGSLVQRVITWVIGLVGYVVYANMTVPKPADSGSTAPPDGEQQEGAMAVDAA